MIVIEGILAYVRVLTNMFHTFDIYMRTCLYVCDHDWGGISNSPRGDFSVFGYMHVCTHMFHTYNIYIRTCLYIYTYISVYIYFMIEGILATEQKRGHISVFGYMGVCTHMIQTYNIYIRTCLYIYTYIRTFLYIYTYISIYIYFMIEGILATAQEDTSASSDTCMCSHACFTHVTFTYVHVCTYIRTCLCIYISWLRVH